jgi:tripartite-type tricarboxylate transporter receptor subunit TctC
MPNIPALSEVAPNYQFAGWSIVFAPAGVPAEIVMKLNQKIAEILRMPDVVAKIAKFGATPWPLTPEEAAATLQSEINKFGAIIKSTDLSAKN